jgi:hypothetical protein
MEPNAEYGDPQIFYLPFPKSQPMPVNGVQCDFLLVYDLQATQICTHSTGFKITGMTSTCTLLYRLFLTLVEVCCKYQLPFCLETIPDGIFYHPACCNKKLSSKSNVKGYRMWIPLTTQAAVAFTTQFNLLFNQQATGKHRTTGNSLSKKRRKVDATEQTEEDIDNSIITSLDDLNNAFTLYTGGMRRISVTFDEGTENALPENHILLLLDAGRYFTSKHTKRKHLLQKCPYAIATLESYKKHRFVDEYNVIHDTLTTGEHLREVYMFDPDNTIVDTNTIRWITTGKGDSFMHSYTDLLKYTQPQYIPTKNDVLSVIRCINTATGALFTADRYANMDVEDLILDPNTNQDIDDDDDFMENDDMEDGIFTQTPLQRITDPAFFTPIQYDNSDMRDPNETTKQEMLRRVYYLTGQIHLTTMHRLQSARQIAHADRTPTEIFRQNREIVDEIFSLVTKHQPGIPVVYHKVIKFATELKHAMHTGKHDVDKLTREMVYTMPSYEDRYTRTLMSSRMENIYTGSIHALRYTYLQSVVFIMAYSRCMDCTSHKLGHTTNICIAGPTGSGKSHVAKGVMDCLPPNMKTTVDSSSEKAHLGQSDSDLAVTFHDEMKVSDADKNGISKSELSQYTQMAEGIVAVRRNVPCATEPGGFKVHTSYCATRGLTITCSNLIHLLQRAMKDRLLVATLPLNNTAGAADGIVTEDAESSIALTNAFKRSLQYQMALQARYTCLNAFGVLDKIDMTMFIIFYTMIKREHGAGILKGRNLIEIRNAAMAECLKEVVYLWNLFGIGADNEMRTDTEAIFYNTRSVLTMQHIVTAFTNITRLTTTTSYIRKIVLRMKSMIATQDGTPHYMLSNDSHYYVLEQNWKNFRADILKELKEMGEGIIQAVIETLKEKKTNGFLNIKLIMVNNIEHVCLNRYYAATIRTQCEEAIVHVLHTFTRDNETTSFLTYEEDRVGIRSDLKQQILCPWLNSSLLTDNTTLKKLSEYGRDDIIQATDVLSSTVNKDGIFLWEDVESDIIMTAEISRDPIPEVTEPMTTRPGKHKKTKGEVSPLLIYPEFFDIGVVSDGKYDTTIQKCLLYAGSYKKGSKLWGGVHVNMEENTANIHYITATSAEDHENNADVRIENPLYIAQKARSELFEDMELTSLCNTIFPINESHILLKGNNSRIEDHLTVIRYRKLYNIFDDTEQDGTAVATTNTNSMVIASDDEDENKTVDGPPFPDHLYGMDPRWLPSNTTYLSSPPTPPSP